MACRWPYRTMLMEAPTSSYRKKRTRQSENWSRRRHAQESEATIMAADMTPIQAMYTLVRVPIREKKKRLKKTFRPSMTITTERDRIVTKSFCFTYKQRRVISKQINNRCAWASSKTQGCRGVVDWEKSLLQLLTKLCFQVENWSAPPQRYGNPLSNAPKMSAISKREKGEDTSNDSVGNVASGIPRFIIQEELARDNLWNRLREGLHLKLHTFPNIYEKRFHKTTLQKQNQTCKKQNKKKIQPKKKF